MSASTPQQRAVAAATPDDIKKMKSMVNDIKTCMLVTIDAESKLHSRPMCATGEIEECGGEQVLYFFTYGQSHKVNELSAHGQQCNLAFMDPQKQSYISLCGTGTIIKDRAELEKRWSVVNKAWFPRGLDEPDVALLKVSITKAEFWDVPSSVIAHAVSFAKGMIMGKPAEMGAHKQVEVGSGTVTTKGAECKQTMRGEEGKTKTV